MSNLPENGEIGYGNYSQCGAKNYGCSCKLKLNKGVGISGSNLYDVMGPLIIKNQVGNK